MFYSLLVFSLNIRVDFSLLYLLSNRHSLNFQDTTQYFNRDEINKVSDNGRKRKPMWKDNRNRERKGDRDMKERNADSERETKKEKFKK